MSRFRRNRKGVALLEVMIAIGIIAVVVLGSMQALNVGILGVKRVDIHNIELNLVRSQMNYIKAQDYIIYSDCQPEGGHSPYMTIEEPAGYGIRTTVCKVDGTDAEAVQHVTVRATRDGTSQTVELDGYKINPDVLPALYDLPLIETIEIPVPSLPGTDSSDASRDGTCNDGRFLLFYGYPFTFYIPRDGAVAVTWLIADSTYGSGNRIDLYLYRNADFPNGDGRPDGPFFNERYDYSWDTPFYNEELGYSSNTTCQESSDPFSNCPDCTKGKNWLDDADPNYPRIVLMDNPTCYLQDARYCHDEEVPGWNTPWFCCSENPGQEEPAPADPGWIAHDEVQWPDPDTGNILTTVLNGGETVPSGWYTIFFYNSNPIHSDGDCFNGAPQYCTNPRVFTVETEWASVSFYSAGP